MSTSPADMPHSPPQTPTALVAIGPEDLEQPNLPGSLPAALTSLVGRDAEIAALVALLHRPGLRLLTLTGPGGVGKTRLAVAAVGAYRRAHNVAVWYVPLAAVADVGTVPSTLAQALGVRELPGQPALEAVVAALAPRPAVLVLDNLEHLPGVAALVTGLLERCPLLTVVATSRIRLKSSGEHEFPVPPLTAAEALFLDRARAAQPNLVMTPEVRATIAEICRRLDGLPLAIELAAARTKVLSPAALLARLSNRFQILSGGPQDAPDRHQTMQAAVAWSYDLLTPGDQAVLRCLSVFAGGATLDAIEAVSASADVLDGVMALLDHALIRREDGADGEPRFSMLETIRDYAAGLLDAAGETAVTRDAHAGFIADLAAAMSAHQSGPDKGRWLDRMDADVDNLRAALTWAVETRNGPLAIRIAGEAGPFWMSRGFIREGISWLRTTTALPGGEPRARAVALRWLGLHERMTGASDLAEAALTEALTQARVAGDASLEVRALINLGMVAGDRSDFARNAALLDEALPIAVAVGDTRAEALVLQNMAVVAERTDDPERANRLERQSLERFRAIGDTFSVAIGLINQGGYRYRRGEFAPALAHLEEAVAAFRSLGDRTYEIFALVRIAELHRYRKALPQAIAAYRETIEAQLALGMSAESASLFMTVMSVVHDLGRPTLAARIAGAADAAGDWRTDRTTAKDVAEFDDYLARIRAALGDAAYDAAWAAGRAQPLADLMADLRALEPSDPTPSGGSSQPLPPAVDPAAAARALGLTPREHEIVTLLAEGLTDREIAERLFISRKTASNHVTAVLAKLDLATRSAVGVFAIRHGLLPQQPTP